MVSTHVENDRDKIVGDVEIPTDHLILTRWPDIVLINKIKWTLHLLNCSVPVDCIVKIKENQSIDKYLDLARELKAVEHEDVCRVPVTQWNNEDLSNDSVVKID